MNVNRVAGFIVAIHVRHVPPAAVQSCCAIVDDELKQATAATHTLDTRPHDRASDCGDFALGQVFDLVRFIPILIALGAMPK